jgi:hypothetical protein
MFEEKAYYPVISDNLPKHIKKGHQLIFSRQDLTAREADLFAVMVAHMTPDDWEKSTPIYKFTAHQLSEWLGLNSKHVGSNLRPVAERLASRKIGIKLETVQGDVEFDFRPLFKHIRYKNGELTMTPNDMLKHEYIEYNQGFALINTKNFFELKKEYSKRLYELLSRFKSGGTDIYVQKINDLKGIFGLLDENGKLRKDKTSFKNNSVFMQRCIRDSIEELRTNQRTKKELLFLESDDGNFGFETVKRGRSIIALRFLYRWIRTGNVDELNIQSAQKTIRELELKRLQKREKLSIEELESLVISYRVIGKEDTALEIEKSVEKRKQSEILSQEEKSSADFDNVLDKIEELKKVNQEIDY